jgi:hypothetical protein
MSEELGISVQTVCYKCQALVELCPDCQEDRDSRDIENAHRLVEDGGDYIVINKRTIANSGSLGERNPDSLINPYPSGHDWTERDEYLEPIAMLVDRLFDLETSVLVTSNERICDSCHYVYNKWLPCPNCN